MEEENLKRLLSSATCERMNVDIVIDEIVGALPDRDKAPAFSLPNEDIGLAYTSVTGQGFSTFMIGIFRPNRRVNEGVP